MVTCSGAVTGGLSRKPSGAWVRKSEDKQPTTDLDKIKETFVHASKKLCITDPPGRKGKEPEISDRSMELCSDWKVGTSATTYQEVEPASNLKSFLHIYLKLIQDGNV